MGASRRGILDSVDRGEYQNGLVKMSRLVIEMLVAEAFFMLAGVAIIRMGVDGIRKKTIGRRPRMYVGVAAQVWGAVYVCLGLACWAAGLALLWFWAHGNVVA
jgi:hypothetical protein